MSERRIARSQHLRKRGQRGGRAVSLVPLPAWWPPKRGDKLRMFSYENAAEYLCHVVSVFRHDGKVHATIAYYGRWKQWWHYEIVRGIDAHYGRVWPNGQKRPTGKVCR